MLTSRQCGLAAAAFALATGSTSVPANEIVASITVLGTRVTAIIPTQSAIEAYYAGSALVRTPDSKGVGCPTISAGDQSGRDLKKPYQTVSKTVPKVVAKTIKEAGCVYVIP